MIWDSDTVFVLGAGFTKAFLPQAPLLVDDYDGPELKSKFGSFPEALAILEMEMDHPDHSPGLINLERLMTRLVGGMPYDHLAGNEKPLALLQSHVKESFVRRLRKAEQNGLPNTGDLWLFARHCIQSRIDCITFNYDDVLDQWLFNCRDLYSDQILWSPDAGYGFPCARSAPHEANDPPNMSQAPSRMRLVKLHGSVNWRIPYGHPKPIGPEAIRHHASWFYNPARSNADIEHIARILDPEPLMVPPILTKADLVEQPILRIMWSFALQTLQRSKRVVFIGYSLPPTDIASGFLFREGLRHLDQSKVITVVDFALDEVERNDRLEKLGGAYKNVFPKITKEQFQFGGGVQWIRDNLTKWLFDSKGKPIAFKANQAIISRTGRFIGTIRGYYASRNDIWEHHYVGEIVNANRLLSFDKPPSENRGGGAPSSLPGLPTEPPPIDPIELPARYHDVKLPQGWI